jgi:hypothetical protein
VPPVPAGIMVEVPATAVMAAQIAREADFFSIGTNDLTQYTLAMDRGHPKLAPQVDGLNPAVLRLIAHTVNGARPLGRRVGVCGGIASDPRAVPIRYLVAATFGNVHGVYKPGQVKLKPSILRDCQDAAVSAYGDAARFYFVFHGGSGSELQDIHEALDYGVVKMNVDTDMQYAFTRAIAHHVFRHYDGVLRVDGEVGDKKAYDPRSYLALAESAMAERVQRAATELRSAGRALEA